MQISENLEFIVRHICMYWFCDVLGEDVQNREIYPGRLSAWPPGF